MKGLYKQTIYRQSTNSMMIARGKGDRGEVEEGKWRINGDGRKTDLGW